MKLLPKTPFFILGLSIPCLAFAQNEQAQPFTNSDGFSRSVELPEISEEERKEAKSMIIRFGKNESREIPDEIALQNYSNTALRALSNAVDRDSWAKAYDLSSRDIETLVNIFADYLNDFDQGESEVINNSCDIFYSTINDESGQRDADSVDIAYDSLLPPYSFGQELVNRVVIEIRTDVSEKMANTVLFAINNQKENGVFGVQDQNLFNSKNGISDQEYFDRVCKK